MVPFETSRSANSPLMTELFSPDIIRTNEIEICQMNEVVENNNNNILAAEDNTVDGVASFHNTGDGTISSNVMRFESQQNYFYLL